MRVFKSHFKDPDTGQMCETEKWYVDFLDHKQTRRRMPTDRCRNEKEAERFGQHVEQLVIAASNSERLDAKTDIWLRSLSKATIQRFVKFGLIDGRCSMAAVPLRKHLEDFERYLAGTVTKRFGRKRCPRYIRLVMNQLHAVMDAPECEFRFWSEVSKSKVEMFLGRIGESGATSTYNSYVITVQQFGRWMVGEGRAAESPVERIDLLKNKIKTERRALDADELVKLLEATAKGPTRHGMAAKDRCVAYLLAVELGLRVEELRNLRVASFDWDDAKPYAFRTPAVRLAAEFCKNRTSCEQVLKRDRSDQLKAYFAGRALDEPAFPTLLPACRTAQTIRADAKTAGIVLKDRAGRVLVFHSLRHSLATALDRTGISLATRMAIMRHSVRGNITLGIYTSEPTLLEKRTAIEQLPALPWPGEVKQAEPVEVVA